MQHSELEGSARTHTIGDRIVGRANPHAPIQITVEVKPEKDTLAEFVGEVVHLQSRDRKVLSRDDYASNYGASASDLQKVERFGVNHGLAVVPDMAARITGSSRRARRTVELRGSIGAVSRAFGVRLYQFQGRNGPFRGYTGTLKIPTAMNGVIRNVLGIDNRIQAVPHTRMFPQMGGFASPGLRAFSADQVAKLYGFPTGVTGKGQVVALIELGGGYWRSDLKKYFKRLGLPAPRISNVPISGGQNAPTGNPNDPNDDEVNLDIQVLGAVAPGAKIVVYFAPPSSRGFLRAVHAAIHDNVNKPSVISISWGQAEASWRAADMVSFDTAFQAATAMGITVCCAAGDGGSNDGVSPGYTANVDFPGSSWFVTSCGGTRMESNDGKVVSKEVVWNDGRRGGGTGGGFSEFFALPPYQSSLSLPPSANPGAKLGRAVPDISGNADPRTGYKVRVDGADITVGGTSAVAPLMAGLVALMNEGLQRQVGFLNNMLYTQVAGKAGALRAITVGNNDTTALVGGYEAGGGWNACTGLGAPANGSLIMDAIR
jgi:kumamolisin